MPNINIHLMRVEVLLLESSKKYPKKQERGGSKTCTRIVWTWTEESNEEKMKQAALLLGKIPVKLRRFSHFTSPLNASFQHEGKKCEQGDFTILCSRQ